MAELRSDSAISRRVVRAFLDFLKSVQPAPGVDLEGLDVARECLEECFKLNSFSSDDGVPPGMLIKLFSSLENGAQGKEKSTVSPLMRESTSCTTSYSHQVKDSTDTEVKASNVEDQARGPYVLEGGCRDELFSKFFAALDKINFFKTSPNGVEDSAQVAKATELFNDVLMEMENCEAQTINLNNLAEMFKLKGKIHGVSISGGSGGRGSSSGSGPWSSPASGLALHRGQHSRQYRSPTGSNGSDVRSNGSVKPLKEEESGGYGSANVEKALSVPTGFSMVRRKKDFRCMERVRGRLVNVLEGLELHTGVFSVDEQKKIVDYVYDIQEKGRKGMLRERTYSEPRKWMRGKGRVTVQFGCCYNYAMDKNGNPPGIIRDEEVDPIPPLLKSMIKRMVEWHVLPPTCIPNSCIINIYDKDDCIPPHIDHHDFVRPFCTVSFLTECNILFGADLKILGPGEFSGSTAIPLPKGSVLVLKGNGADVAKHCVPAVPAKRISITFRKMDDAKHPFEFTPDPELQNLRPLPLPVSSALPKQQQSQQRTPPSQTQQTSSRSSNWSSRDQNSSGDVSHSSNGTPGDKSTSEKKQSIASGEKFVSPVQFVDDDFPSFSQKQSQQRTQPSQASRHWNPRDQNSSGNASGYSNVSSADKSTGEKKQSIIASGEKFVSPVKFGDDEFPSLGSGALSKPSRKPGRSLRQ